MSGPDTDPLARLAEVQVRDTATGSTDAASTDAGSTAAVSTDAAAPKVRIAVVTDTPPDLVAHERAVGVPAAGAHVVFQGVVRDHDHGRTVVDLDYEGHPSATQVIREVAEEIAEDPDVVAVAVSHRIGSLAIGDVALIAAVGTAHRGQAFAACARLVDEVKARLPIWKRQTFDDGTDEWVNCP